jgi:hypothetical protein
MRTNLATLLPEIHEYLESRHIAVFHGAPRGEEDSRVVYWDTARYPDYRAYIASAEIAQARLVTVHGTEFDEDVIDDAMERLEESTLPREERRSIEQRLRELRGYSGFISQIELSFDIGSRVYIFELRTDWYDELNELLYRLDEAFEETEEDDGLGGGYFSKN